jgi:hypothetical protein
MSVRLQSPFIKCLCWRGEFLKQHLKWLRCRRSSDFIYAARTREYRTESSPSTASCLVVVSQVKTFYSYQCAWHITNLYRYCSVENEQGTSCHPAKNLWLSSWITKLPHYEPIHPSQSRGRYSFFHSSPFLRHVLKVNTVAGPEYSATTLCRNPWPGTRS